MSENYIVINGKRAELTEEQLKALGIEVPKANPFERAKKNNVFYYISDIGDVNMWNEHNNFLQNGYYNVANYCTDKAIMEQRALHEILNRLLWRYSMEHEGDKIDWSNGLFKYTIKFDNGKYDFAAGNVKLVGIIYFLTKEIAQSAIKEIIEPFMKEHPEFKF